VHDLQGMGCDLEYFVVKWDQQFTEDEQAGKGGVGIVLSKSDATVRKASAAARPTMFCCHRTAQLVVVPMACTKLVVERSLHARSMDCAAARRWFAARREPANVLIRGVESLPMHHDTHTHGGRSGHFDLSAGHLPPYEVARKTAKRAERSHGLCHGGMLRQSHAGRKKCCSHASSAAVDLRDRRVGASKCLDIFVYRHMMVPGFSLFFLVLNPHY